MINIDEQIALLPCPFCNKPDTAKVSSSFDLYDDDQGNGECWAVFCDASNPNGRGGCGASGGFKPAQGEAIDAWNKRATLQSIKDAGDDVVEPSTVGFIRARAENGNKEDASVAEFIDTLLSAYKLACVERDELKVKILKCENDRLCALCGEAIQHCDAGADQNAIESVITTAVNEALELASRECDQTAKRSERDLHGSVRCAAAIRKLKVE